MYGFRQDGNRLIYEFNHEQVQIEPWGHDSLRVRATMNAQIRENPNGALLDPAPTQSQIEFGESSAVIRNGKLAAEVSLEEGTTRFSARLAARSMWSRKRRGLAGPPRTISRRSAGSCFGSKCGSKLTKVNVSTVSVSTSTDVSIKKAA